MLRAKAISIMVKRWNRQLCFTTYSHTVLLRHAFSMNKCSLSLPQWEVGEDKLQ